MQAFTVTRNGRLLLEFTPRGDENFGAEVVKPPLQVAVMIARCADGFLLVRNRYRNWELPGGFIAEGETAKAAAIRELYEETGQKARNVRLIGRIKLPLVPEGHGPTLYGVLFGCEVGTLEPFSASDEISELAIWRGQAEVGVENVGVVSEVDRRLIALF